MAPLPAGVFRASDSFVNFFSGESSPEGIETLLSFVSSINGFISFVADIVTTFFLLLLLIGDLGCSRRRMRILLRPTTSAIYVSSILFGSFGQILFLKVLKMTALPRDSIVV